MNRLHFLHPTPDFLYVASSMTACVAFSEESRMRLANAPEVNRKSGEPEADFEKMGLSAEVVSRFDFNPACQRAEASKGNVCMISR